MQKTICSCESFAVPNVAKGVAGLVHLWRLGAAWPGRWWHIIGFRVLESHGWEGFCEDTHLVYLQFPYLEYDMNMTNMIWKFYCTWIKILSRDAQKLSATVQNTSSVFSRLGISRGQMQIGHGSHVDHIFRASRCAMRRCCRLHRWSATRRWILRGRSLGRGRLNRCMISQW